MGSARATASAVYTTVTTGVWAALGTQSTSGSCSPAARSSRDTTRKLPSSITKDQNGPMLASAGMIDRPSAAQCSATPTTLGECPGTCSSHFGPVYLGFFGPSSSSSSAPSPAAASSIIVGDLYSGIFAPQFSQ